MAGSGEYRLVNRYFEADAAAVLTAALDGFGAFLVKPDSYRRCWRTSSAPPTSTGARTSDGGDDEARRRVPPPDPLLGTFRHGYVAPAALLVAGLLYAPFSKT